MSHPDHDNVRALRGALEVSPDNLPLRLHLVETLMGLAQYEEAEAECREALARAPNDDRVKETLARAFYQQQKDSHAMVIVEQLVSERDTAPSVYLLHARLLLRAGDVEFAVSQYKQAVREDQLLRDWEFEARLGIEPEEAEAELVDGQLRAGWDDASPEPEPVEVERPQIDFGQVGGMEDLKEEIRMKIVHPLEHAEMFRAYGKEIGGGVLMYGPPGCGKTHLARATAGQIRAGFISVGINEILEMWIGSSERNLHAVFAQARASQPCVLFFDEVDALGASRTDLKNSAGRHLVNQFLAELDGAQYSNEGVLILAATNAPWHMDGAFRRPGRFDRILFVPPPDEAARAEILRLLTKGKPVAEIDYAHVAKKTKNFSGADLKAVVDLTIEAKLGEAMKKGVPQPITTRDLTSAVRRVKPSTKDWFATAKNYALYSNQGGLYDDILKYLNL